MSSIVLAGVLVWVGIPVLPLVVAAAALAFPVPAAVAVVLWVAADRWRSAPGPDADDEAFFLESIAAELDGGASPRAALVAAAERPGAVRAEGIARVVALGLDSPRIAVQLAAALPLNGRLAGAAWAISAESGAPLGPVVRLLAQRAGGRGRLLRERRALTAQARATAWLIGGLPVVLFIALVVTGRIGVAALPVAMAGAALQAVGIVIVLIMLRRRP